LKIPKATGSFLYSVYQNKPSYFISVNNFWAKSSRFVVSSRGFTSSITRDIAVTSFFTFLFAASFAISAIFFAAAAADSSSPSSSPNKSSKSSSFFYSLLGFYFFTATAPIGKMES
jgi:hypothetical protein